MQTLLHHPALGSLLFCSIGCIALAHACTRIGLARKWALLLWLNLLIPGFGLAVVLGVLCHRDWPRLPKPPVAWRKTSLWGRAP